MKKVLLLAMVFIILLFTSCQLGDSRDSISMTGIMAVDANGMEVKEDVVYQANNIFYEHKNIKIIANYSDGSSQDATDEAVFSKVSLAIVGEYKIIVTLKKFKTTYQLKILENSIDHLFLSHEKVKLNYKSGEKFDSLGLVVEAVYKNGDRKELKDYDIQILDGQKNVISKGEPLAAAGQYIVEVNYLVHKESFMITVVQETQLYSSIRFDVAKMDDVYYGTDFDFSKIKAFGVLANGQEVALNAEDWITQLYYRNQLVGNFNEFGSYEVRTSYLKDCSGSKSASYSVFYTPYETLEIVPLKTVYQESEILDLQEVAVYGVRDNQKELVSTSLYKLSLSYDEQVVSSFLEDGFYDLTVTYKEAKLDYANTSSVLYFSNSITKDLDTINTEVVLDGATIYSDAFSFSVVDFINYAPTGYLFSGVQVTDKEGQEICDVAYDGIATNIAITGLEANTEYVVKPYYDLALTTYSSIRLDVTPGYRIHFVGFVVLTSGDDVKTHIVRLKYDNLLLYTILVAHGDAIPTNFLEMFLLPIQYENYYCAGTKEDISIISEDRDVEVVLIPTETSENVNVVFYDRNHRILKVETLQINDSATPPEVLLDYVGADGKTYSFVGWSKDYTNVTHNLYLYPKYIDLTDITPRVWMSAYVSEDFLSLYTYVRNYSNCSDYIDYYEIFLCSTDGGKTLLDRVTSWFYSENYLRVPSLNPDTDYTLEIVSTYHIEGETKTNQQSYSIKTLKVDEIIPNVTLTLEEATYMDISVRRNMDDIEGIFCIMEDLPSYFHTTTFRSNDDMAVLINLKHNTRYSIGYYDIQKKEDDFVVYSMYVDQLEAATLDAPEPIIPEKMMIIIQEESSQIFIPVESYQMDEAIVPLVWAEVYYMEFSMNCSVPLPPISEWGIYEVGEIQYYYNSFPTIEPVPDREDYYVGILTGIRIMYFYDETIDAIYSLANEIEWEGFGKIFEFIRYFN